MAVTDGRSPGPEVGEIVVWSGSRWRVDDREDGFLRLVRVDEGSGALAERGDTVEIMTTLVGAD